VISACEKMMPISTFFAEIGEADQLSHTAQNLERKDIIQQTHTVHKCVFISNVHKMFSTSVRCVQKA